MNEWIMSTGGMILTVENESTQGRTCPPQIWHAVAWHWTRSSTMRGRPLTTWAMAWSFHLFTDNHSLVALRTVHYMKWYEVYKLLLMHATLVLLRQKFRPSFKLSGSKLRVVCSEVCYFYVHLIFFPRNESISYRDEMFRGALSTQ